MFLGRVGKRRLPPHWLRIHCLTSSQSICYKFCRRQQVSSGEQPGSFSGKSARGVGLWGVGREGGREEREAEEVTSSQADWRQAFVFVGISGFVKGYGEVRQDAILGILPCHWGGRIWREELGNTQNKLQGKINQPVLGLLCCLGEKDCLSGEETACLSLRAGG